jgi:hypothetical protein
MNKKPRVAKPKRRPRLERKSVGEIALPSARDLARLRGAMKGTIDTTEIPEGRPGRTTRARLTEQGKPVAPPESAIRDAIRRELGRREITRYELWKRARAHCRSLPESAVYEFLRGERQIGLEYVEALLAAVDLEVRRRDETVSSAR